MSVHGPFRRIEDEAFVSGHGRYVDDTHPANSLYAAFVRSPHAAARIVSIDTSAAAALPGVLAVLTGADFACAISTDTMRADACGERTNAA